METPRTGLSRVILFPNRDQGDLSIRSPICRGVHVCVSMHAHACVHLHACVWVWTEEVVWMTRVSRGEKEKQKKRGHRIDIAKWIYVPRDWVCVRTRENNLLMTSSVRHVNDTN